MSERIEKLRAAVQVMHRCLATHAESVPIVEMFRSQKVWEGVVEVFDLKGHPKAKRCYGWSYPDGTETRFVAVLEIPPVESPQTAVRAAVMAQSRAGGGAGSAPRS